MNIPQITNFQGANGFLSNFYPSPLRYGVIDYPTVEHAFQAAKTIGIRAKLRIANSGSPGQAKRLGRSVDLRPDWETRKDGVMLDILRIKFEPHTDLGYRLAATNQADLIEGNSWHDQYWGDCFCAQHKETPGNNILGALLMKVRDEVQLTHTGVAVNLLA